MYFRQKAIKKTLNGNMERRKRERSRSPVYIKERDRERYSRERVKERERRKGAAEYDRVSNKSSHYERTEVEHRSRRTDSRETDRREPKHERYNNSRRHEHEEQVDRRGSRTARRDDRRNVQEVAGERAPRHGRDRSQDRNTHRTDEQRERHRRHDIRRDRDQNDEQRSPRRPGYHRRQRGHRQESDDEPDDSSRYGIPAGEQGSNEAAVEAEKPNFGLSGKLTEYTNTYKGVVIKYNEPPEGRKPKTRWRLYPFKGDEGLPVLYIHRQSAYLLGRQRHIADIPIDHPSCSKQHAVLQYRLVDYERPDGTTGRKIKPYIIDLESANGTFLNNQKIEPRRYYELKERDVLKFGFSSREYVILHEKSLNTEDQTTEQEPATESGRDEESAEEA